MAHSNLTLRTARWSAEHPWRALLLWVVFVAAAVATGTLISTQPTTNADYRIGESGRADQLITDSGLAGPPTESVLIEPRPGASPTQATTEATQAAGRISDRMAGQPVVESIGKPTWSQDHQALLVPIQLVETADDSDPDVAPLRAITEDVQTEFPSLRVSETGDASLDEGINQQVADDLSSAEGISLPVTFVIMLLAFGALLAAGIPVLLAISGVVATIGLYAPLSYLIHSEPTVSSMVVLIGMAVGVDYSLFYLKRAREERDRGRSTLDAVEIAAATSGHSIIVSGAAVIVSMAGLYVVQDATFSSLATGAILVVAVAVLGSITVLPALVAKLGRWVDRPRVPLLWRLNRRIGRGGISRRVLGPVLRHPKASLLVSSAAVVGLAVPALGMNLQESTLNTLPQTIPAVQTMQRVQAAFPSEGATIDVVAKTSADRMPQVEAAMRRLEQAAGASDDFAPASGTSLRVSGDSSVAVLTLATTSGEGTPGAEAALDQLRTRWVPQYLSELPGTEAVVGGGVADSVDYLAHQRDKLPWVIGFVLLLTLLMMGVTFRSVPIAILTTLLNLASVAAAFGVLSLVFQHSWAEQWLDFTSSGAVISWIPLFMFVVLIGLSMDYHVFVLSRVKEGIDRGLPPRLAVEHGVSETAGVVTSAAAVMVSVFAIFATLSMLEMKQMGVGLAAAILIDATLIRVVMLPSLLVLMGRWAWWPHRPTVAMTVVTEPAPVSAPGMAPGPEPVSAPGMAPRQELVSGVELVDATDGGAPSPLARH